VSADRDRLDEELKSMKEGYRKAIEKALERVPARNGVVSLRDLWLETSLPEDLLVDTLREDGIAMPPHVMRVDLDRRGAHGRKRK